MFPSSTKDNKFCCKPSTCPKRYQRTADSPSSSSSVEDIPKNSSVTTSSTDKNHVDAKTSEKSSEADFDRNYPNISYKYNKFCPSHASETSQPEPVVKLKFPDCCQPPPSRHKCTCRKIDIESSSGSSTLTSEYFPLKLNMNIMKHLSVTPERLQPKSLKNCVTSYHEQFYSCSSGSSENSESDEMTTELQHYCYKSAKSGNNFVILELLQEVINLVNECNLIREEVGKNLESKIDDTQEFTGKVKTRDNVSRSTSISRLGPTVWPQSSCLWCNHQALNFPFVQPYDLKIPAAYVLQLPAPFVNEETNDRFKDCTSDHMSELTADKTPANLCCICSNITDICPKHGPLKVLVKRPDVVELSSSTEAIEASDSSALEKQEDRVGKEENECKCEDLGLDDKKDMCSSSLEMEPDVDEELHPRYVDKLFIEPFGVYIPTSDCLLEYDDEEPTFAEHNEIHSVYEAQTDFEPAGNDKDQSYPDLLTNVIDTEERIDAEDETNEAGVEPEANEINYELPSAGLDQMSQSVIEEITAVPELQENIIKEINETNPITEEETSTHIVHTSSTSDIENNKPDESRQPITFSEPEQGTAFDNDDEEKIESSDDAENELTKEKSAESYKRKERDDADEEPNKGMALTTINQREGEGSSQEMKFFIDSLIMDLKAMDYARRKSEFEKNIRKPKSGLCARDSFPVTISDVKTLGANSLYVKWTIHDYCDIGGYEIYTDGHLTNRYYSGRHDAAVITHVDVTLPHKVALVAQSYADDDSIELICNMISDKKKPKSLIWKTAVEDERNPHSTFWTPSIFLYDPLTCA